ncbi:hypothetical protein EYC80_001462 [Monilinia laxa]|uniref:DUF6604 domain-containing protein n=1 Tax=Monilinia laxa TaxID=61186 RepID=A0A5N6K521_MONLA|nr:hypothetical protein EYC80_001462 [Monilinia laxa]
MYSFPIDDTYVTYKRHEERFINGLGEAGSKAGYGPPCTIRGIDQIKNLVISLSNDGHEIPQPVRDELSVVMQYLKEALVWYKLNNQADQGRTHYLRGLQEIWDIIENPGVSRDGAESGLVSPVSDHSRAGSSKNSFEDLSLEDLSLEGGSENSIGNSEENAPKSPDIEAEGRENVISNSEDNAPKAPDTKAKGRKKKSKKKKRQKKRQKKRLTTGKSQSTSTGLDSIKDFSDYDDYEQADKYMRVYFFFKDIKIIKHHISNIWRDYRDGLISLLEVSVVTNTAFQLLKHSENELMLALPRHEQNYQSIATILYPDLAGLMPKLEKYGRLNINELHRLEDGNDENEASEEKKAFKAILDANDYLCYTTWLKLSTWHKGSLENLSDSRYMLHRRSTINYKVDKLKDQIDLGFNILEELLVEGRHIKHDKGDQRFMLNCGGDEFTNGMREFLTKKRLSPWLVFAAQVMCDIRSILGLGVIRCHEELLRVAEHFRSRLLYYSISVIKMKLKPLEKAPSRILHDDLIIYALKDYLTMGGKTTAVVQERAASNFEYHGPLYYQRNLKNHFTRDHGPPDVLHGQPTPEDDGEESFYYLRRNPLMCGLMIFLYTLRYNGSGVQNVSSDPYAIACAHLYNAVSHALPGYPKWKDMYFFIIGREMLIFAQNHPPSTTDNCIKSFNSMRSLQAVESRSIMPLAELGNYYHKRVCFMKNCKHQSSISIEQFLTRTAKTPENGIFSILDQLFPPSDNGKNNALAPWRDEKKLQSAIDDLALFRETKRLSHEDLLRVMARCLVQEKYIINFDFHEMHLICADMLKEVYEGLQVELKKWAPELCKKPKNIYNMPVFLFKLAELRNVCEVARKRSAYEKAYTIVMEKMGGLMAKVIEEAGSRVLNNTRKFAMQVPPTTLAEVEQWMNLPYSAIPTTSGDVLNIESTISELRRDGGHRKYQGEK